MLRLERSLVLLLALPALTWAADPAPAPAEVSPEMKSLEETAGRYKERMAEFSAETRHFVEVYERDQRDAVERQYLNLNTTLEEDNHTLRSTAIKRFESFLTKYPTAANTPHVMFRLAELYFEESEEAYLAEDNAYRNALDAMADDPNAEPPLEPKKDYRRSMELYQRIIDNYPGYQYADGCHYMMGYCRVEPNSKALDEVAALASFQAIIDKYPKSQFAASAHLRVGEYYFDRNDIDRAIVHYEKVVQLEGPEGKQYANGLYKLAWSYYKKSGEKTPQNFDVALGLLDQLLLWSGTTYLQRYGKASPTEPEAIEYTAISIAEKATTLTRDPLVVAKDFYNKVGNRTYEPKVYKRLADVLTQQARYDEAIAVYHEMQTRWPNDPENPTYQFTIAQLHNTKLPKDVAAGNQAISELTERYNDDTPWWRANRNNPDALNVARRYIETSLSAVATRYHIEAGETGRVEDFSKAADLYGQYLKKFPFAKDYYQIQWYRADTLQRAGRVDEAEHEYALLMRSSGHNFREAALYNVWNIQRVKLMALTQNRFDVAPLDAAVEKKVTLENGQERSILALSDARKAFIDLTSQLGAVDFEAAVARVDAQVKAAATPEEKEVIEEQLAVVKDHASSVNNNVSAIPYLSAQILFYHGRFDEARPRLMEITDRYPESNEAVFSCRLMMDSYTLEDDLDNVKKYALFCRSGGFGPKGTVVEDDKFQDFAERASFEMAVRAAQKGTVEGRTLAVAKFQAFLQEFPNGNPSYRQKALYNLAVNLDKVGRVVEANNRFEEYIRKYPNDTDSRGLYLRIAGNYAQALDFAKAIELYTQLYELSKNETENGVAADALYNASQLKVGLGDIRGAAAGYEQYARDFRDRADAEGTMFKAGDLWLRVSDAEASRFFKRYLDTYPSANPNHVLEVQYRLVQIAQRAGKEKEIDRAWDDLEAAYARLGEASVGPVGRHYAAMAALRRYEDEVAAYKAYKFSTNDTKNGELILERLERLPPLRDKSTLLVNTYKDFEASSGALYLSGVAFYAMADLIYNAPPPKGLSEDELIIYNEELDKKRIPLEDLGRGRLELALSFSKDQAQWSEWQVKALTELSNRYPSEYAPEKVEVRAEGDSSVRTVGGVVLVPVAPTEGGAP